MQFTEKQINKSEFLKTQIIEKYKTKQLLRDHFFYHSEIIRGLPVDLRRETIGNFLATYKNLTH